LAQAIFHSNSFVDSGTIFDHAPEPFSDAIALPSPFGCGYAVI